MRTITRVLASGSVILKGEKLSAKSETAKVINYTAEQTAEMVSAYTAKPEKATVEALALKLGKSVKSIVAKLVREKVYKKAEYVSKSGEPVAKKNDVADAIGAVLKMNENDIDSLTKCNKTALSMIWKALANSVPVEG
jgi:hypothetical protein